MSEFFSPQCEGSVPPSFKNKLSLLALLYKLVKEVPAVVDNFISSGGSGTEAYSTDPQQSHLEKMLRGLLREHIPAGSIQSQRGNLDFLVNLALCDVEEVTISPFGEVKEITMGYGGTSGASILRDGKYSKNIKLLNYSR